MLHPLSQHILDHFQIRKGRKRKSAFLRWFVPQLEQAGYKVRVEEEQTGARNIVVGNLSSAEYVFTAHYDTPATVPVPNISTPDNLFATILFQLFLFVLFLVIALAVNFGFTMLTGNLMWGTLAMIAVLLLLLYQMMAGIANKNNYNDNTSGVIAVLETALALPPATRDRVCFVFFDLEELGLIGSAGFQRRHHKELRDKLVFNLDCVAAGDSIHISFSKSVRRDAALCDHVARSFLPEPGKEVLLERGFFFFPSDQMNFKRSAAICALKKSRLGVRYLSRIHTNRDTAFDERNIRIIRDGLLRMAERRG